MKPAQESYRFPIDYPQYFEETKDGKKVLKIEYLTTLPEDIAKFLEHERPQLAAHQLRSFYGHVKRTEHAWRRGLTLPEAVNEIKKLESHANDRLAKGRITRTFHDFVRENANRVVATDEGKSLEAFLEHFEALVGFCAGRLSEKERT
jgi:hypothetical protein